MELAESSSIWLAENMGSCEYDVIIILAVFSGQNSLVVCEKFPPPFSQRRSWRRLDWSLSLRMWRLQVTTIKFLLFLSACWSMFVYLVELVVQYSLISFLLKWCIFYWKLYLIFGKEFNSWCLIFRLRIHLCPRRGTGFRRQTVLLRQQQALRPHQDQQDSQWGVCYVERLLWIMYIDLVFFFLKDNLFLFIH